MKSIEKISRRDFLVRLGLEGGGLVLGMRILSPHLYGEGGVASGPNSSGSFQPNVFLSIGKDGQVTIVAHRSEMGTGIRTSLPMVVADELEADWDRVAIVQAIGDRKFGSQNTDGSRSIKRFFDTMREAGATARQMLESAAAEKWGVRPEECRAEFHEIVHRPTDRRIGFGDVAEAAAHLPVPAKEELRFKSPDERRYVGKPVPIADLGAIVDGTAKFGLDVLIEGMKFATIERCPVLGGKFVSYDREAALAVDGVDSLVEIRSFTPPHRFQALGGIAVVGKDTWSVLQGRKALSVKWESGKNRSYDSQEYRKRLSATSRKAGRSILNRGDVGRAFTNSKRIHEADYYVPHLAHASMEPPCAVASVTGDRCEAWAPTQTPQSAQKEVAQALGLDIENVTINVTLLGGGFGRKSKPDFIIEAALLSKEVGAPVKVIWSREDDIRHDYLHTVSAFHAKAGFDHSGKLEACLLRSVFPSIGSTFNVEARTPSNGELGQGLADLPFDIPNFRCETGEAEAHVRIGWLRSVCNIFHCFAVASFVDELAATAKRDRVLYLKELLGPDRLVDPSHDGAKYGNYGESLDRYPIDTGRYQRVINRVAEASGWGRKMPDRIGLGIAVHHSFLSYIAAVAEVSVTPQGEISIPRITMAVDCGLIVNPDRVRSQMEGAAVFGGSLALMGEITSKGGRIEQSNFHDYPVLRMHDSPKQVDVHIIESEAPPAGVGEPGVPPIAPAICNAIFSATGKRIRRLPVSRHDLSLGGA